MRALLVAALLLLAASAAAQTRVGVRVGDHPKHGRVVLDWPTAPAFETATDGDTLRLRFPDAAPFELTGVRRPPRNVAAIVPVAGGVDITVSPGARPRVYRLGARLVVDVFPGSATPSASVTAPGTASVAAPAVTPAPAAPAVPAALPAAAADATPLAGSAQPSRQRPRTAATERAAAPAASPAAVPRQATSAPVAAPPGLTPTSPASPPAPDPAPAPPSAASRASATTPAPAGTAGANARPARPAANAGLPPPAAIPPAAAVAVIPAGVEAVPLRVRAIAGQPRAVPLPFQPGSAAVAVRRGDLLLVAFDQSLPLDLTPLRRDPIFAALETQQLPGATLLRLPLGAPGSLRLRRDGPAWLLEAGLAQEQRDPAATPIVSEPVAGLPPQLALVARGPGKVLTVSDPLTGLPLLLGPVAEAAQPVPATRRLAELDLLETLLGVAVLARSDAVTLRPAADRFLVAAASGLVLDPATALADAAAMTRTLDLPVLPVLQLAERLRAQRVGIAEAPPLARFPLRFAAAETLLALGLPHEAQAMLALAAEEDARGATDPRAMLLGGAAALLAGRLGEAQGIDAADLPASDETTLWRSLHAASRGEAKTAAPGLAATVPLLLGYPEALKTRLLPLAAETLAAADARRALRGLLATQPDDAFPLPRGMLAEAAGDADAAVAAYAAAANGNDRRVRARALRRSIELRLARGTLDHAAAAQALEATLFTWRDETEEIATRLRIATLRGERDGRGALALLRETEALFPEHAAQLLPRMQAAFLAALGQEPPLAAIALHDAYPELLPADATGEAAVARLADALIALDLPDRAAALLRAAAERANTPTSRATLGLRLGELLFSSGDGTGALAALSASETLDLPPTLHRDRRLLAARIEAATGNGAGAVATLRELGSDGAAPLAELFAERGEWAAAAAEHATHLRALLPEDGSKLPPEAARAAVRQAALLALAGDEAGLVALRRGLEPRLAEAPLAPAFAALTAPGLRGLADLPRLQRELALFRALPNRLEALRAGAPVTR